MEMEILDAHDTPPEVLDEDGMWDNSLDNSNAQPFGVVPP
jgi:hypothetical protein